LRFNAVDAAPHIAVFQYTYVSTLLEIQHFALPIVLDDMLSFVVFQPFLRFWRAGARRGFH